MLGLGVGTQVLDYTVLYKLIYQHWAVYRYSFHRQIIRG
jgi:hypothetical protein